MPAAPCSLYTQVGLTRWRGLLAQGSVRELARQLCQDFGPLAIDGIALSVSTSKGDPLAIDGALAGNPGLWPGSWPGDLGPEVARLLGIRHYLPCHVVAACSTGLYGLLAAADAVESGRVEHGVAMAVEGSLPRWLHAGFACLGVLAEGSPDTAVAGPGHDSRGFLPAAGAGIIALDRTSADTGWHLTAGVRLGDAGHETHFADPRTLEAALEALWEVAGPPDLIVPHATGTPSGDAYEGGVLNSGPWARIPRWCPKPVLGHSLGASGLVELALALDRPVASLWKISLGFGGHLAAVAIRRS